MPQIKTSCATLLAAISLAAALSGCGDVNSQAGFDSIKSAHLAGWLPSDHAQSARTESASCSECHGEELNGGISAVSCTSCHLGDPADVHPLAWGDYGYARHSATVNANGTASCANANCHGPALAGVSGSGPACATTCHIGGAAAIHPAAWPLYSGHADYVEVNGSESCANIVCHGSTRQGVFLSGPSCFQCHPYAADDKHPPDVDDFPNNHKQFIDDNGTATCSTSLCHGAGGAGPSCSTSGCH